MAEDASCFHRAGAVGTELGISGVTDDTSCLSLREGRGHHRTLFFLFGRSSKGSFGGIGE